MLHIVFSLKYLFFYLLFFYLFIHLFVYIFYLVFYLVIYLSIYLYDHRDHSRWAYRLYMQVEHKYQRKKQKQECSKMTVITKYKHEKNTNLLLLIIDRKKRRLNSWTTHFKTYNMHTLITESIIKSGFFTFRQDKETNSKKKRNCAWNAVVNRRVIGNLQTLELTLVYSTSTLSLVAQCLWECESPY